MDAARERAEESGQRERADLVHGGVDAHHLRGVLVLADGDEPRAEAAAGETGDHARRRDEQDERELVEERVAPEERKDEADVLARESDGGHDGGHHRCQPEGGDGEIGTAQAQDGNPEEEREGHSEHASSDESHPEREVELRHGDGRPVGAETVEHGVAERRVARESADDVPPLGQGRDQERVDAELDQRVGSHERHRRQPDGEQRKPCPLEVLHARPRICAGFAMRTRTSSPKLMMSVKVGSR